LGSQIEDTFKIWGERIFGCDLHSEFVRAAQIRLTLLAASLHSINENVKSVFEPQKIFSGIRVCDSLKSKAMIKTADCVVINPPFGYTLAPTKCQWASGKIQIAGLFFEEILKSTPIGHRVVGILPDVLRSGTRYRKWRTLISGMSDSIDVKIAGPFDDRTGVDVFVLDVIKSNPRKKMAVWPTQGYIKLKSKVVSDFFNVHVGPVVPHREPNKGTLYPYLHARNANGWLTLNRIDETRSYLGRVFTPPFVVVHRTSSPKDKSRCVGAIVNEIRNVAIENHLIVFQPHDGKLETCKTLVKVLKSKKTTNWLNTRIRCRHLTVSALANLPYNLAIQ
jgi:hypothetical protein